VQIVTFFEKNLGPVAKLNVQRDCRQLISLGNQRHTARLATERALQHLLRYGCGCGTLLQPGTANNENRPELTSLQKQPPSVVGSNGQQGATAEHGGLSPGLHDPSNANQPGAKGPSGWKPNRGNRVAPGAVAEAREISDDAKDIQQGIAIF
jgi:hypothetical protein